MVKPDARDVRLGNSVAKGNILLVGCPIGFIVIACVGDGYQAGWIAEIRSARGYVIRHPVSAPNRGERGSYNSI